MDLVLLFAILSLIAGVVLMVVFDQEGLEGHDDTEYRETEYKRQPPRHRFPGAAPAKKPKRKKHFHFS